MEILGIDVGFGYTKACNSRNSVIFKSVIGDALDIPFDTSLSDVSGTGNLHVTVDNRTCFLGDHAERQSTAPEFTLDQETLLKTFFKVLALTAVATCTENDGPLGVVTGLPVGYLRRDGGQLQQLLQGSHEIIIHDPVRRKDVPRRIFIEKILVIPQPIGSIFNLIFDDAGTLKDKEMARQKLGVVDIGFKTTDFSIFDRLQYIERGSATLDRGMSKCFAAVANKLRQESSISVELYRIFQYMEAGMIKVRGREYNIAGLKKRIYTQAASSLAADVNRLWENDWDMDAILLSGGGSVELAEYLSPLIDGQVIPMPEQKDPRMNNARGYYKFGVFKWPAPPVMQKIPAPAVPAPTAKDAGPAGEKPESSSPPPGDPEPDPREKQARGFGWLKR